MFQLGLWLRILLAALVQVGAVIGLRRFSNDWLTLGGVGFAGWAVFYLVWFGAGLANESDRRIAMRLVRMGRA